MMGEIMVRSRRTFQSWGFYVRRFLFSILSVGPIPAHIAFIMDGNRRYAKKMNLEEGAGHKVGFLTLLSILKYCYELGVKYTTVYAFSIDNFKRSPEEVQLVMNLLLEKIEGLLKEESIVNQYGVRVYFIGNMKLMDEAVRSAAEKAMKATANNKRSVLLVCLAYTSSDEIVNSVQESCIEKWHQIHELGHQNGEIQAFVSRNLEGKKGDEEEDLGDIEAADSDHQDGEIQAFVNGNVERKKDEEEDIGDLKVGDIERHMHMAVAPDPDILIRSSGETRLSNFLLWQTSNCVLLCPRALWPEMGLWHLVSAVLSFQRNYPYIEKKKKQDQRVLEKQIKKNGKLLGSKSVDVNPSFSNTEPSTPATTQKTNLDTGILGTSNGYSTGGGLSGTTNSSAAQSGFSVAASDDGYANGEILPSSNLKVYTFADMKSATRGFKSDSVLGIGGFGTVFKGWVDEKTLAPARSGAGMVVAIKKLNHESMQGFQEWQSEVNFLGRLSHPNLVKLLGYCWEDEELLLVYEFLSKGSLENHLFRRSSTVEPLSWDIRIKIALGAARGLAFLHGSEKKIIYRDFKASNILLDADYNAKISDFGLAKLGPSVGESHVTTRIMGTYGYAAPEYIATGHLYVQSDVYGFGVVLLELLSGLRVYDSKRLVGNTNLVEWMQPFLRSKRKVLKNVMDESIKGRYSTQAAVQTARITLKCLEPDPRKRVSMKRVVQALEEIKALNIEEKEPKQVPWRHYSSGPSKTNPYAASKSVYPGSR